VAKKKKTVKILQASALKLIERLIDAGQPTTTGAPS
jgi:hypothetical protein